MIRWCHRVLARRLVCLVAASVGGCWSEEPLIHDAFTADQWAQLQRDLEPPPYPTRQQMCAGLQYCDLAATLGQKLFFDPRLSGTGTVSCATCHDARDATKTKPAAWFIDTRPNSSVSQSATGTTAHNTITVVNVHVGTRENLTWTGDCIVEPCQTPLNVVHDIALPKAMASDPSVVGNLIRTVYLASYRQVFGDPLGDVAVQYNVGLALDAYMWRLVSLDSPFDRFITGQDNAMDAAATRGFALFVGRAMCIECHSGQLLSDDALHVTGVIDGKGDTGHQGTGKFFTPPLRNVARTAPYMHNGSLATLADVIQFYRWGGAATGYAGDKDPLMAPLDITDDEAHDLEAFLHSLDGAAISSELRKDTHEP